MFNSKITHYAAGCCTASVFVLMMTLHGCSEDAHDHPDLVSGEQLFNYHCAGCHKVAGIGNFLKGIPSAKDTYLTQLEIAHKVKTVQENSSKMPNFPNMSDEEARKIAAYVKSIKP
ncbi:MAG: cytochrome c [Candidatus Thiodiazotropha sp.]